MRLRRPTHVPAVAAAAMAAVTAAAGKNALLPNRAVQEKEVDEAEEAALGAAATGTEGGYAMAEDGHGVEVEEDWSPGLALEQNTAAMPVPGPSELSGGSLQHGAPTYCDFTDVDDMSASKEL